MNDDGVGACQLHTIMAFYVEFNTVWFFDRASFVSINCFVHAPFNPLPNKQTNTCTRTLNGFNNKFDQIVKCVSIYLYIFIVSISYYAFVLVHSCICRSKVIGFVDVYVRVSVSVCFAFMRAYAFDFRLTHVCIH